MKEITIPVYTFEELTPAVQERVIDRHREWRAEDFDAACTVEDLTEIARLMGVTGAEWSWSVSYCQGDGASLTGRFVAVPGGCLAAVTDHAPQDLDLHRIAADLDAACAGVAWSGELTRQDRRYSHEHTVRLDLDEYAGHPIDAGGHDLAPDAAERAERAILLALRDFMRWGHGQIVDAYEDETGDESIREYLVDQGEHYRANGEREIE